VPTQRSSSGCDGCEFLTAVGKIKKHDAESWYSAWNEQDERALATAESTAQDGLRALAKNAYLEVANSFRAALYLFFNNNSGRAAIREVGSGVCARNGP
jgi:hypothetical protein